MFSPREVVELKRELLAPLEERIEKLEGKVSNLEFLMKGGGGVTQDQTYPETP